MNNQQPFNNQVELLRFSPLLKNQPHSPTSHYLLVRADVGRKSGKGDPLEVRSAFVSRYRSNLYHFT